MNLQKLVVAVLLCLFVFSVVPKVEARACNDDYYMTTVVNVLYHYGTEGNAYTQGSPEWCTSYMEMFTGENGWGAATVAAYCAPCQAEAWNLLQQGAYNDMIYFGCWS